MTSVPPSAQDSLVWYHSWGKQPITAMSPFSNKQQSFRNSSLQKAFTDLTNKTKHHNFEKEKPHCEHFDWFKWSFWVIALRKPCSKHHLSPLADSFEVAVAVGFQHLPPTLWVHPEQSGFTIAGVFPTVGFNPTRINNASHQQCQSQTIPLNGVALIWLTACIVVPSIDIVKAQKANAPRSSLDQDR